MSCLPLWVHIDSKLNETFAYVIPAHV